MDAVLLRAYREFVKKPAGREIGSWLIQLATEQLQAEVKRLKSQRDRTIHVEENIPETPPVKEVTTLGEEIREFYQPDEKAGLVDPVRVAFHGQGPAPEMRQDPGSRVCRMLLDSAASG